MPMNDRSPELRDTWVGSPPSVVGLRNVLLLDTSGNPLVTASGLKVQGAAADGALVAGNPILVGGQDGTNAQSLLTDTTGRPVIVGAAAAGAAIAGNPVLTGGSDGTLARALLTTVSGRLQAALPSTSQLGDGHTAGGFATLSSADAVASPAVSPYNYNGSTWDRQRTNIEATLLTSAARTTTTNSSDQVNYNAHGLMIWLNITVASGTGGLQIRILGRDALSTATLALNALPTAKITTGLFLYTLYPAALTVVSEQHTNVTLPRTWLISVVVGDASSYTYSVGCGVLL